MGLCVTFVQAVLGGCLKRCAAKPRLAQHKQNEPCYEFDSRMGVCRGNPEGVAAALPTSPDRGVLGSHPRVHPKPEPQRVADGSDLVMQDVKQDPKPLPSPKPQVRCFTLQPKLASLFCVRQPR